MLWEVFNDIQTNALEQWDYSPAFPSGFAGITQPIFVPANHWQIEAQIEILTNGGQLTQVLVSLETLPGHDEGTKTFSDIYQMAGAGPFGRRIGSRIRFPFSVGVFANEQLGGFTTARKLSQQVIGAMFYYRNRLTTIRHINLFHSQEVFLDSAQLFNINLTFEGDVHITIDV